MMWLAWTALIIGSYLLGSIPTAYILVKMTKGIDIRNVGSGNVGSTNSVRVAGKGIGLVVFAIDVLKGVIPVLIGLHISQTASLVAGMVSFFGHIWPVWLKFSGGKGVATGFGVGLATSPWMSLIVIGVWLVIAIFSGYVSVASCSAAILLFILIAATERTWACFIIFAIMAGIICLRHKKNFINIKNGTEGRSFRKHK